MANSSQKTNIRDNSVNDSLVLKGDGSTLSIQSDTTNNVTTADPLTAQLAIAGNTSLAGGALDFGAFLTDKALSANQDLANNFRDLAEGAQTTLRDTLAVALNSEQLAGKASASVAPSSKVIVAVVAVVVALGLVFASFIRRPAKSKA